MDLREPQTYFAAQTFAMKDGDVMFISNSGAADFQRFVNTSDDAARARFNAASAAQRERIRASLRRAGAGHIQLRTDRDWVHDIARFVLSYRRVAQALAF